MVRLLHFEALKVTGKGNRNHSAASGVCFVAFSLGGTFTFVGKVQEERAE